jgi:hypothetical protein
MTLLDVALILSGPIWALVGAWIYYRGCGRSSPLPTVFARKIAVTGDDDASATPNPQGYQRL